MYLVSAFARSVNEKAQGSVVGLWAQAWLTWLTSDYRPVDATDIDLQKSLDSLSHHQMETLYALAKAYPNELTGSFAIRLLAIREGPRVFENRANGLFSLVKRLQKEAPDSHSLAVVSVYQGSSHAQKGEWKEAAACWLDGMRNYPFEAELPALRKSVVNALMKSGSSAQAQLLTTDSSRNSEIKDLLEGLISLRQAQQQAENGDFIQALNVLSGIRHWVAPRAATSQEWNEFLQQIEAKSAEVRVMSGSVEPQDIHFDQLIKATDEQFADHLAFGIERFGSGDSFARAAMSVVRERLATARDFSARNCWAIIASTEAVNKGVRSDAFTHLLECELYTLQILKLMPGSGFCILDGVNSNMIGRMEDQEMHLLSLLTKAEELARSADIEEAVLVFVDKVHTCYRSIGVTDLPKNLYLDLATQGTPKEIYNVAEHARMTGESQQAIDILIRSRSAIAQKNEPSRAAPGDSSPWPNDEALLRLLITERQYSKAAGVAFDLAIQAYGDPNEHQKWYRSAELIHKAKDYSTSADLINERFKEQGNPPSVLIDLKKLQILNYFFLEEYRKSFRIMEELRNGQVLSKEETARFACLRAYHSLTQQKPAHAVLELRRVQFEEDLDGPANELVENFITYLQLQAGF